MAEAKPKVPMRINASGFSGESVSLIGMFDPATDLLLIAKALPAYEPVDRPGFLRITNQQRDQFHDAVFLEENTREAILAYFDLTGMGLVNLADAMKRFDPLNAIEPDGLAEGGRKFRIRPEITNGQFGVLMACYFAQRQRDVAQVDDAMDEFSIISI